MTIAYLSVGSNLGKREAKLFRTMSLLGTTAGIRLVRRSPIYETEPQDVREQPWFLNMVVQIETTLAPEALLDRIHEIERDLGRERMTPKGPRTIDIDILLYGDLVFKTERLEIPHPRLGERRFVLEPLTDLLPAFRHPITGQTGVEMLEAVEGQSVRLYRWR